MKVILVRVYATKAADSYRLRRGLLPTPYPFGFCVCSRTPGNRHVLHLAERGCIGIGISVVRHSKLTQHPTDIAVRVLRFMPWVVSRDKRGQARFNSDANIASPALPSRPAKSNGFNCCSLMFMTVMDMVSL